MCLFVFSSLNVKINIYSYVYYTFLFFPRRITAIRSRQNNHPCPAVKTGYGIRHSQLSRVSSTDACVNNETEFNTIRHNTGAVACVRETNGTKIADVRTRRRSFFQNSISSSTARGHVVYISPAVGVVSSRRPIGRKGRGRSIRASFTYGRTGYRLRAPVAARQERRSLTARMNIAASGYHKTRLHRGRGLSDERARNDIRVCKGRFINIDESDVYIHFIKHIFFINLFESKTQADILPFTCERLRQAYGALRLRRHAFARSRKLVMIVTPTEPLASNFWIILCIALTVGA